MKQNIRRLQPLPSTARSTSPRRSWRWTGGMRGPFSRRPSWQASHILLRICYALMLPPRGTGFRIRLFDRHLPAGMGRAAIPGSRGHSYARSYPPVRIGLCWSYLHRACTHPLARKTCRDAVRRCTNLNYGDPALCFCERSMAAHSDCGRIAASRSRSHYCAHLCDPLSVV